MFPNAHSARGARTSPADPRRRRGPTHERRAPLPPPPRDRPHDPDARPEHGDFRLESRRPAGRPREQSALGQPFADHRAPELRAVFPERRPHRRHELDRLPRGEREHDVHFLAAEEPMPVRDADPQAVGSAPPSGEDDRTALTHLGSLPERLSRPWAASRRPVPRAIRSESLCDQPGRSQHVFHQLASLAHRPLPHRNRQRPGPRRIDRHRWTRPLPCGNGNRVRIVLPERRGIERADHRAAQSSPWSGRSRRILRRRLAASSLLAVRAGPCD